ncbi:hypothetical protein GPECTOR_39g372 [Gonium pectorale]|uniref:Acyl carrier protein n=1 Tax=Gonium pectorale TaxID=33097 RepID=A0A150GAM8_GONPE|nr:hypothetical protein GPECTOR_39g372 [Gonium pectorale]|eukprot:KXZ46878.1 hypothetical protein GPECTOR_39g372 [Gonium pectorale]
MALNSAASMLKTTVLKHLRVSVTSSLQSTALPTFTNIISRGFGGGFLDKDAVTERVLHVTKHFEKIDASKVSPAASFEKDLGLDSLDVVELVMALEEEFGVEIPDAEADKISSVGDAINYICSNPMAK